MLTRWITVWILTLDANTCAFTRTEPACKRTRLLLSRSTGAYRGKSERCEEPWPEWSYTTFSLVRFWRGRACHTTFDLLFRAINQITAAVVRSKRCRVDSARGPLVVLFLCRLKKTTGIAIVPEAAQSASNPPLIRF